MVRKVRKEALDRRGRKDPRAVKVRKARKERKVTLETLAQLDPRVVLALLGL